MHWREKHCEWEDWRRTGSGRETRCHPKPIGWDRSSDHSFSAELKAAAEAVETVDERAEGNGLEDTRKEDEKECGGYWDTSGGMPEVVAEDVVVVVVVVIVAYVGAAAAVVVEEADMGEAMWLHRYSQAWVFYETWYYSWWTPDWIFGGYS